MASLAHGFASVSNFFPGTKVLASELMEHLARGLMGEIDVTRAKPVLLSGVCDCHGESWFGS